MLSKVRKYSAKENIAAFDFVRVFSAFGIIAFHFSCHTNSTYKPLFYFANGDYGFVFVTVFLMLSGAVLYYQYADNICLRVFYYKRWKSIFPMFYIAFIYYYYQKVFETSSWSYNGSLKALLWSFLGMDGYLSYRVSNYFLVGEWYVGAIVILYILFPLLNQMCAKSYKLTVLLTIVLYFGMKGLYRLDMWKIAYHQNLVVCLVSFVAGMLVMKFRKILKNRYVFLAVLFLSIIIIRIKIPFWRQGAFCGQLLGILLFFILVFIGNIVMKMPIVNEIVSFLSKLAYPAFLIQHQVILKVFVFRNPVTAIHAGIVFVFIISLILIEAAVIDLIAKAVMNSKCFMKLERKILAGGEVNS